MDFVLLPSLAMVFAIIRIRKTRNLKLTRCVLAISIVGLWIVWGHTSYLPVSSLFFFSFSFFSFLLTGWAFMLKG